VDNPQHRDSDVAITGITDAADELDGIDPHVYQRRWKTLAVLCTSLLIIIVGNTVLNVALPTMSRPDQLGASNTELQWIVDAYGLVFAGLLFSAGALGDRFGRKGALQLGLLVFASGSLFGAFADSSAQVIAARAIMGAGAAFVMPSTLSVLTNVFPSRERARAIAIWAGIAGAGAAIGPLASGLLLDHFWSGSCSCPSRRTGPRRRSIRSAHCCRSSG
jgi:MFS transporter, DHA2 family, integral membrane protein